MLHTTPNMITADAPDIAPLRQEERETIANLLRQEASRHSLSGMTAWELRDLAHRVEWGLSR